MTTALPTSIRTPDATSIAEATALLRAGACIGLPTETVYGLAADACNDDAVAKVFAYKNRPDFNPLIVHVGSLEQAATLVDLPPIAHKLAEAFWPGPLTLVLDRTKDCPVSLLASAGLATLAIRMPAHRVARQLLQESDLCLAAPSANPSGRISPTTAHHVASQLNLPMVLDGGPCDVGLESTILRVDGDKLTLLRPGGLAMEEIEAACGTPVQALEKPSKIMAPGQLLSHYAPSKPVRLNADTVGADEALLAFGEPITGAKTSLNLSPNEDLTEAAANLFAMLHALDGKACSGIAVMPIPDEGLGQAINDRLRRAAAPRDRGRDGK
jgi:L-threonylcarbamoyladenylate synthase